MRAVGRGLQLVAGPSPYTTDVGLSLPPPTDIAPCTKHVCLHVNALVHVRVCTCVCVRHAHAWCSVLCQACRNVLKDVAIPLMQDPRWERDTLFMVFEEDFRFTPHDAEPSVMKASGLQEVVNEDPAATAGGERVPLASGNTVALPLSFLVCLSAKAVEPSATAQGNRFFQLERQDLRNAK